MIISLNLRNNEKLNYYITKEKIEYLTCLISNIENLDEKDNKIKEYFNDILYNLFSTEYIHLDLNLLLADKNPNVITINTINFLVIVDILKKPDFFSLQLY